VPEQKVMFRQNPNIEILNTKQIRISNDKMTQTNILEIQCFFHWNIFNFDIVSDFVLRISNFYRKRMVFGKALVIIVGCIF